MKKIKKQYEDVTGKWWSHSRGSTYSLSWNYVRSVSGAKCTKARDCWDDNEFRSEEFRVKYRHRDRRKLPDPYDDQWPTRAFRHARNWKIHSKRKKQWIGR